MLDREAIRSRLRSAGLVFGPAGRCWEDAPASGAAHAAAPPAAAPRSGTPAAVLITLVAHPDGPRLVLTERTAHLRNHAAQISFPGGRIEKDDAGPAAAALREAREEIGLAPERVDLLGCLPCHLTVSDFLVHPVVGWVEPPVDLVPDPHEVAQVFEVPLDFVLDPANQHRESRHHDGVLRSYYVLPYPGHRIWGATAEILVELAGILA